MCRGDTGKSGKPSRSCVSQVERVLRAALTCWTLIKVWWLTLIHATWTGTKASGKGTRLLWRELPGRGIPVPVHEEQQQSPTCGP